MKRSKLTQSLEDYLEVIHVLLQTNKIARIRDIAAALTVKMPSVARAVAELKKQGLVSQEPYSGVELTEEGKKVAVTILSRHLLLRQFLIHLGVSEEAANEDACNMEHILSAETLAKIEEYMKSVEHLKKRKK
ncbi:MAG: DtxR family transcriptional regulator [Fibrobacter sp.]|jgi:DtxR family Mn-dependent transcriptional regulator|uniref:metal-dependent transcriptional regulator n=1 Tax=Fibrobacter sp. TaxID=35828 RepID=UPI0025BD2DBB|nr:iron dependent repressor, metal binding and dimerization domain protein [Fibrobacter sp.]MBQ3715158.1 DtxR family transcriptional regulator [Fibrobacter sp.]MBQ3776485.1 DtxR family transcriptional regulator [Fibrobacter sp.]MBQ7079482.1 DtxR family transcriptional regulator [Fibrobacter sp.]